MATIGTVIYTWLHGRAVGTDELGNRYFKERKAPKGRREKRWVLYAGEDEASRVPAGWHAWLHYSRAAPPSERPLQTQAWEKPHVPNLTGTAAAYRPPGHPLKGGKRAPATGDYEAWKPD